MPVMQHSQKINLLQDNDDISIKKFTIYGYFLEYKLQTNKGWWVDFGK